MDTVLKLAIREIMVIGGAGNVGKGVVEALKKNKCKVTVVDPKINFSFEEISDNQLKALLANTSHVVYAADCGNRDEYEKDFLLREKNNRRFKQFCQRVAQINDQIVIWYIGGSWTKRKPTKDWLVTDDSPNKLLDECNPYEKAKIRAERNAERLSDLLRIRFLDWISIVPNLAENFTVPRMVKQALEEKKISYSPGDYGRPLLESRQAGEALVLLIAHDNQKIRFEKFLIPGAFTRFEKFAMAVKEIVENRLKEDIELEIITKTPEFLKSKTRSYCLESLGFVPNRQKVIAALKRNAKESLSTALRDASFCQ